jgi:hypothetical protein
MPVPTHHALLRIVWLVLVVSVSTKATELRQQMISTLHER